MRGTRLAQERRTASRSRDIERDDSRSGAPTGRQKAVRRRVGMGHVGGNDLASGQRSAIRRTTCAPTKPAAPVTSTITGGPPDPCRAQKAAHVDPAPGLVALDRRKAQGEGAQMVPPRAGRLARRTRTAAMKAPSSAAVSSTNGTRFGERNRRQRVVAGARGGEVGEQLRWTMTPSAQSVRHSKRSSFQPPVQVPR